MILSGPAIRGLLGNVAMVQLDAPTFALERFLRLIMKYAQACADACEGEASQAPAALKLASGLQADFHNIMAGGDWKGDAEFNFAGLMKDALARLCKAVDELGLTWIKGLVESKEGEVGSIGKLCQDTIAYPTPFLSDCITTCDLVLAAEDLPKDFGAGFHSFAATLPSYVRVSSINKTLMETISKPAYDKCIVFQKQADDRLEELCSQFEQNVSHLDGLVQKYGLPGVCSRLFGFCSLPGHLSLVCLVQSGQGPCYCDPSFIFLSVGLANPGM